MNPSGDEPPDHWLAFTRAGAAAQPANRRVKAKLASRRFVRAIVCGASWDAGHGYRCYRRFF